MIWEKEVHLLPTYDRVDIQIGLNQNRSLNQRTSETQTQHTTLLFLNTSYLIRRGKRISLDTQHSITRIQSDQLFSRNFDIRSLAFTPSIQTRIHSSWETSFSISYAQKNDRFPMDNTEAHIWKFSNSNRTYLNRKVQLNSLLEWRNAKVKGASSSLGNYEINRWHRAWKPSYLVIIWKL